MDFGLPFVETDRDITVDDLFMNQIDFNNAVSDPFADMVVDDMGVDDLPRARQEVLYDTITPMFASTRGPEFQSMPGETGEQFIQRINPCNIPLQTGERLVYKAHIVPDDSMTDEALQAFQAARSRDVLAALKREQRFLREERHQFAIALALARALEAKRIRPEAQFRFPLPSHTRRRQRIAHLRGEGMHRRETGKCTQELEHPMPIRGFGDMHLTDRDYTGTKMAETTETETTKTLPTPTPEPAPKISGYFA